MGTTFPAAESARPDQQNSSASNSEDRRDVSPVSEQTPEQAPERDYVRDFISAMRGEMGPAQYAPEAPPASESPSPEPETERGTTEQVQTSAEAEVVAQPAGEPQPTRDKRPDVLTVTQEELERKVQSEADRRLDKFQREQARLRKAEEERRLRDNDPYGYAQMMREREAEQQANREKMQEVIQFTSGQIRAYDREVLDPIFLKLPKDTQKAILENIEEGIPARGKAAKAALDALEKHWKGEALATARRKLLEDQAFVKEILARYAGNRQEPDSVPAVTAAPAAVEDPNDYIRNAVHAMRNR
jgi:hypothetical protein